MLDTLKIGETIRFVITEVNVNYVDVVFGHNDITSHERILLLKLNDQLYLDTKLKLGKRIKLLVTSYYRKKGVTVSFKEGDNYLVTLDLDLTILDIFYKGRNGVQLSSLMAAIDASNQTKDALDLNESFVLCAYLTPNGNSSQVECVKLTYYGDITW